MPRRHRRDETPEEDEREPLFEVPYDPVNEQVLIASAAIDTDTRNRLTRLFKPDHFHGDGHAAIWAGLTELTQRALDYDPNTLHQVTGGRANTDYLQKLIDATPAVPANLKHHITMMQWDRVRSDAVNGPITQLLEALQDLRSPPERVRALARAVSGTFESAGERRHMRDPSRLVTETMDTIDGRMGCYPYGIEGVDRDDDGNWRMVPGAAPKQCTVITGVSGTGKSTIAGKFAFSLARQRRRVLYGAWEMSPEEMLELLGLMALGYSRTAAKEGKLKQSQKKALRDKMDQIAGWVKFLDMPFDRTRRDRSTNEERLDIVQGYIEDSGCEIVVFDLWNRMLKYRAPDDEEAALFRMQGILKETNTHGILCHQQRLKDIEQRADKRPTREGNKGTSAWVDVADTMFGIHAPWLWKNIERDVLEIDILKQRYGRWPIAIEFNYDPDTVTLSEPREIDYYGEDDGKKSKVNKFINAERRERRKKK